MTRHKPTAFDDSFEELLTRILTDREILVVVLRGHLVAEALTNDIYDLFRLLGASKTQVKTATDSTFRSKIDALYAGDLIDERGYKPLVVLNRIRNSFAHLPLKTGLSEEDEAEFLNSFESQDRVRIIEDSENALVRRTTYRAFRYGLLNVFAHLRVIVEFGRRDGLSRFPKPTE